MHAQYEKVIESFEMNMSNKHSASTRSSVWIEQFLMNKSNIQYPNCGGEYVVTDLNAELNK